MYANSNFLGHFALIKKGSGSALSTIESEIVPTEYALEQNYPNPFNPETRISYDIAEAGEVSLIVYDILGRKISTNTNQPAKSGGDLTHAKMATRSTFLRMTSGQLNPVILMGGKLKDDGTIPGGYEDIYGQRTYRTGG